MTDQPKTIDMLKPLIGPASSVLVRHGSEYGHFFFVYGSVVTGDDVRHHGTWTSYSSYGVYGHFWYSMGAAFPTFVQDVSADYLLGKITSGRPQEFSYGKTIKHMRDTLSDSWRNEQLSPREHKDLIAVITSLNHTDDAREFMDMLDQIDDTPRFSEVFCDRAELLLYDWPQQAKAFTENIWPRFVEAIKS